MSRQDNSTQRRSVGGLGWLARALGAVALFILLMQLLDRGVISWGQLAAIGGVVFIAAMVLGQLLMVPWLAHKESKHPRITTREVWESPLPPAQALGRIRAELADLNPDFHGNDASLQVTVGSDVTFRRRGTASELGWQALPLLATFHTTATPSGCQVTAAARDNLGWYPNPPAAFVAEEINRRNAALIQRARRATEQ